MDNDHGFKSFGEWVRAVRAAEAGGEPDPRLVADDRPNEPLTEDESRQIEGLADRLLPGEPAEGGAG